MHVYLCFLVFRIGIAVIQRNVRKYLFLRNWSWWKLYTKVTLFLSLFIKWRSCIQWTSNSICTGGVAGHKREINQNVVRLCADTTATPWITTHRRSYCLFELCWRSESAVYRFRGRRPSICPNGVCVCTSHVNARSSNAESGTSGLRVSEACARTREDYQKRFASPSLYFKTCSPKWNLGTRLMQSIFALFTLWWLKLLSPPALKVLPNKWLFSKRLCHCGLIISYICGPRSNHCSISLVLMKKWERRQKRYYS